MRRLKHDLYTAIGTIGPTSRRRQDCIAPPTRQGSTPAPLVGAVGSLGGGIGCEAITSPQLNGHDEGGDGMNAVIERDFNGEKIYCPQSLAASFWRLAVT
jgi:hypothetical protein